MSFDPRVTLARPDLADARLEGLVRADRYAPARPAQAAVPVAAIRKAPADEAEVSDQLLFGEVFDVLEERDGWAWGQARRDGYVGYVQADQLSASVLTPTHTVTALEACAFAEPGAGPAPVATHSLNALVTVEERRGGFVRAARSGWFAEADLAPVGDAEAQDPVAVAERLRAAPYSPGGRESSGLDGSGLVQQALYAAGRGCPRDADQQERALGREIPPDALARGDLVFWRGHVAIGLGQERVLHANSAAMAVSIDTLADALDRNRAVYGEPVAWRRV